METKKCSKCNVVKEVCEFYKDSKSRDKFRAKCKSCIKEETNEYSKKNRQKRNELQKKWRLENIHKTKEYRKKYYNINPEKFRLISKIYRENNPDIIKKHNKKYYINNLTYHKTRIKKWVELNREKRDYYLKLWKVNNKEHIVNYKKNRYKNDELYKLITNCRNRLNSFLKTKNLKKCGRTLEMIGCTSDELKIHIEKQFKNGMSWENRNEWHIDHIIPLSQAKNEYDVICLSHYSNLQPLWVKENLKKSNKIIN
jgi:hypothetical protein